MGKILWPSARAMGTSITLICKSDAKEKVLNPIAIAMEKALCPFLHVTSAESWKSWKRHICRKMSCHVIFNFLHVTFAHLHICTFGKWTTKRQIGNPLPREKWEVIFLSFVFVIWKIIFCICICICICVFFCILEEGEKKTKKYFEVLDG